jgi:hypothetical protein
MQKFQQVLSSVLLGSVTGLSVAGNSGAHSPSKSDQFQNCSVGGFVDKACKVSSILVDEILRDRLLQISTSALEELPPESRRGWLKASADTGLVDFPPDTRPLFTNAIRADLVRRAVYVTKAGDVIYIADRGGALGQIKWYGPFNLSGLLSSTS